MRNLQMLRSIQAFEAAARKQSYVEAAVELSVTPAAIGQQVRALEAWLGVALFKRLGSGSQRLVLTDVARAALPDFEQGLDRLDQGLRRLRQQRLRATVTVSASQSFVARWLLPRMPRFNAVHPDVDVLLDVSDRLVDLEHGEADLAIRCGAGRWARLQAERLMDEEVFPVCSLSMLKDERGPRTATQLSRMCLIHDLTMAPQAVFPTWNAWLQAQGVTRAVPDRGMRINSSAAVIQAAIHGQGVALARRAFVVDDLASGHLVRLLPHLRWPITWGYYVVRAQRTQPAEPAERFVAWLREEAAALP
jgi:LysR family transcriptional regulator, glycine cleavage system transcriptional activator